MFRVPDHLFMGWPVPRYGRLKLFGVSEHRFVGCPIPTRWSFQVVSRFNPKTSVAPTTSTSSLTPWLCVIVCAVMHGIASRMYFTPEKELPRG